MEDQYNKDNSYPNYKYFMWLFKRSILTFIYARVMSSGGSDGKASVYNAGDLGSIPESGRSPGEGNGNPLQFSCLENPMDGGGWWATVHGVAKSQTRLSDFTFTFHVYVKPSLLVYPSPFIPLETVSLFSTSMTLFQFYK